MFHKTRGIILHTLKYGDSGIITTTYTEDFGRISFMMQGTHGKKSQIKSNLLQPLFLLELEVDEKPGRELQRVKEIKNLIPFQTLPFEITKSTQAFFIAEILGKVLREEESRPDLFEFLFHSIQIFDLMQEGINNFHLLFLIQLTRYLGFSPTNNYNETNQIFDLIGGKFVPVPPSHQWFLKNNESKEFSGLIALNYQNASQFKPTIEIRRFFTDFIINYYSLHLGYKLNLKSLEIIREVLN